MPCGRLSWLLVCFWAQVKIVCWLIDWFAVALGKKCWWTHFSGLRHRTLLTNSINDAGKNSNRLASTLATPRYDPWNFLLLSRIELQWNIRIRKSNPAGTIRILQIIRYEKKNAHRFAEEQTLKTRNGVVTCEIKLFWNNFENSSVFYLTRNHVRNWNKITSAAEGVLKLFQNYFSDNEHVGKYSWAAISLWNNFEIIYIHM